MNKIYIFLLLATGIFLNSCSSFLDEEIYSELSADNYLNQEEGVVSLLQAAYAKSANMAGNNSIQVMAPEEFMTDIMWQTGDGVASTWIQYINFTLDPTTDKLTMNWNVPYQAILYSNTLLENLDNTQDITDLERTQLKAEARFIRAISYYKLYLKFGAVPLRKSTKDDLYLARTDESELIQFIETELTDIVDNLYTPWEEPQYGRATSGAANGYLCLLYLNTKQWQKCANIAQDIIDSKKYSLFPEYEDMFKVENEQNSEYIWVRPAYTSSDRSTSNSWMNTAFPEDFYKEPRTGLVFDDAWRNWPNEYRMLDGFVNTFENGDKRKNLIITKYINSNGDTISLLNNDNTRSFKYWPDPSGFNASFGNDMPEIRYAEILLARAEALNELNGPNQESVDLVNEVRERAGIEDKSLTDFTDTDSFRDYILTERGWEFYCEGKRRLDLIRMGKFISGAQARGKTNAKEYHKLFPIPQTVIDSNPELIQNEGY